MTISDKSIEAAARALRHQDEGEGAFDNLPKHQKEQDKNRAEIIIEAYLAAERTQGRDWEAIESELAGIKLASKTLLAEIGYFALESSPYVGLINAIAKLRAAIGKE